MKKNLKYKLISFNGTSKPAELPDPSENYWTLIGQVGTLVHFSDDLKFGNNQRVLIKFDKVIIEQGLACHNAIENALWILKTDLKKLDSDS